MIPAGGCTGGHLQSADCALWVSPTVPRVTARSYKAEKWEGATHAVALIFFSTNPEMFLAVSFQMVGKEISDFCWPELKVIKNFSQDNVLSIA